MKDTSKTPYVVDQSDLLKLWETVIELVDVNQSIEMLEWNEGNPDSIKHLECHRDEIEERIESLIFKYEVPA